MAVRRSRSEVLEEVQNSAWFHAIFAGDLCTLPREKLVSVPLRPRLHQALDHDSDKLKVNKHCSFLQQCRATDLCHVTTVSFPRIGDSQPGQET